MHVVVGQLRKKKKLSQIASRIPMAMQVNEAADPSLVEANTNLNEEVQQGDTNADVATHLSANGSTNTEGKRIVVPFTF